MPHCPNCGNQLTGAEQHCPACGQLTDSPSPLSEPSAQTQESLPLGDYLKAGWGLFKQYPGGFAGFCFLNLVIQVVLNAIPYLGVVASVAVSTPLLMGNFIVSAKLLQREAPEFRDFFAGFQFFWPLLLLSLVAGVLISIGAVLLIIPGVYLAVAYFFAANLVVDRRLDFWPAMELSRHTVTPRWFNFFVFMFLLALLNLGGALLLGLGLLVTIPVSFGAVAAAYADLFGLHSDYSQGVPRLKTP
jgi:uncharacterized membrane protein